MREKIGRLMHNFEKTGKAYCKNNQNKLTSHGKYGIFVYITRRGTVKSLIWDIGGLWHGQETGRLVLKGRHMVSELEVPVQSAAGKLYNVMVIGRGSRAVFCGGESVLQGFAEAMNGRKRKRSRFSSFFMFREAGGLGVGKVKNSP